jgi:hypothetical protein
MIILHRPPRQSFRDSKISGSQDVLICYDSLKANIKLLRTYSRQQKKNYRSLPFTFIHVLASTASVILMKRYINDTPWDDEEITRPLGHVLDALDGISLTWPCAKQVRGVITAAMQAPNQEDRIESPESFDFMAGLAETAYYNPLNIDMGNFGGTDMGFDMNGDEFGLLDPASFMNGGYQWDDETLL